MKILSHHHHHHHHYTYLFVLLVIVLILSTLTTTTQAQNIISSTYQVKSISDITNTYSFQVALFDILFDQDLYINGIILSDYNSTLKDTPTPYKTICLPKQTHCRNITTPIYSQIGGVSLTCLSSTNQSYTVNSLMQSVDSSLGIPVGLIPSPNVEYEPFISFALGADLIRSEYLPTPLRTNPRMLSFIMFFDFIYKSQYMTFPSNFQAILGDLQQGRCNLVVGQSTFNNMVYTSANSTFVPPQSIKPKQYVPSSCRTSDVVTAIEALSTSIDRIPEISTDPNNLILSSLQATIFNSSRAIEGCTNLLNAYVQLVPSKITTTLDTDLCGRSFTDIDYHSDPCCNTTLQWTQCCAPRPLTLNPPILTTQPNFGTLVNSTCKNSQRSSEMFNNLISMVASSQNPVTGCSATYFKTISQSEWSSYLEFMHTCRDLIYGMHFSGYACSVDSDCFSGKCEKSVGTCWTPSGYEQQVDLTIACHVQYMDPLIKSALAGQWGESNTNFTQTYRDHVVIDNCVGRTAYQYTEISTSSGTEYVVANKTECLSDLGCQYKWSIFEEAECTTGNYCVIEESFYADSLTFPQYCYYSTWDPAQCASRYGTMDPKLLMNICRLNQYTTMDQCLPPSICPSITQELYQSYNQKRCSVPFCYFPTLNMTQCTAAVDTTWDPLLANGTGLCKSTNSKMTETLCNATTNGVWWYGRGWNNGTRQTQEECAAPLCRTGDYVWLDRIGESCSNFSYCSQAAPLCYSPNYLCYSSHNSTSCGSNGGVYKNSKCTFTFGGDITTSYLQCQRRNYTWVSCSDLNYDQCQQCQTNSTKCQSTYQQLGCQQSWRTDPYTPALCAQGGYCTDKLWFGQIMTDLRGCDLRNTFLDPQCKGVCQTGFIFTSQGEAKCDTGLEFSPIGCTNYTVGTQQECIAKGSNWRWYNLALNQSDCEDSFKVCYDNAGTSTTYKNQSECSECNGIYKSPFTWKKSYWVQGEDYYNTQWLVNSGWGQLNTWSSSIDTNIIEDEVQNIMVSKFAPAAQSDLLCNVMPYVYTLKPLACDCSGDPNTPENCYNNGTQSYLIGTAKVCNGWQEILVSGPLQLTIYQNSVPINLGCIGIEASILPAPQFYRQEILSTDVLSNSIQRYYPYDIVVNNHSVIVGQLIGDGIQLDFSFNRSGVVSSFSGELGAPAQLCIDARSDIDQHFPVFDFATLQGSKWVPINSNAAVSYSGDSSSGRVCANITSGQTYFPILRIEGWEDAVPEPLFTKAQEVFIYIIGIVFVLTALYCAYSLFVQVWGGYIKSGNVKITLPRLLNALLFLFCMVRGLYLILTPTETISAQKNLGGFYFLSEFPIYVFLSLFSSLVFYWAELMHNAKHGKFLERLRWPFIGVNTLMYIMFVVVISVYRRLDSDQQYNMKIVYSTILSALCATFIIGFWLYGGKLILIQIQVLRIKNQSLNRNLRNMSLVLLISSISLTLQIIFLFFNAFSKRVTIAVALIFYVIAELIPCLCLAYISRPRSGIQSKKKIRLSSSSNNNNELSSNTNTSSVSMTPLK